MSRVLDKVYYIDSLRVGRYDRTMKTIRALRDEHRLTQRDLALRLDVTTQTVSNWESARNEPTARQLVALSKLFGVPCDQISLPFDTKKPSTPE